MLLYANLLYSISNDILRTFRSTFHGVPSPTRNSKPQPNSYIPTVKTTLFLLFLQYRIIFLNTFFLPKSVLFIWTKNVPQYNLLFSFYMLYLKTISIVKLTQSWWQMNGNVWYIGGITRRKTCTISTFLTTKPIWNDSDLKKGVSVEIPAINRLSHSRAL